MPAVAPSTAMSTLKAEITSGPMCVDPGLRPGKSDSRVGSGLVGAGAPFLSLGVEHSAAPGALGCVFGIDHGGCARGEGLLMECVDVFDQKIESLAG